MPAVKPLEQLVVGGRDVGEGNPGVLFGWERLPGDVVFVAMADFTAVENVVDNWGRRNRVRMKFERIGGCVIMEFRRVVVRFKKRNMKNGVKARKVRREAKLVSERRDFASNGERTEAAMVELTALVGFANLTTRSNVALGISSQGFSDACEIPLAARPTGAVTAA